MIKPAEKHQNHIEMQEILDLFWQTLPPIWHATRGIALSLAQEEKSVTPSQFHVLRRICKGAHSVSHLADCLNLNRSNVSRTVDELARSGLIERTRDKQDRRNIYLSLTDSGKEIIDELHEKIGNEMRNRFLKLSKNEIEQLRLGLHALQKIFQTQEK